VGGIDLPVPVVMIPEAGREWLADEPGELDLKGVVSAGLGDFAG
jgi:hypothetical protein